MTLFEFKETLKKLSQLHFLLPDGSEVPAHFHVTEVGKITKHFIDCGGTERREEVVSFQLWNAHDYNHRLHPEKLIRIIELSERQLGIGNLPIEVEYQGATIQKFGVEFRKGAFELTSTQTDCLAKDKCGIPTEKPKVKLSDLGRNKCCTPGSGCC